MFCVGALHRRNPYGIPYLFVSILFLASLLTTEINARQFARYTLTHTHTQPGSMGTPHARQESSTLEIGRPIERELVGEQAHTYQLALDAGLYLHVIVDQKGIDVVVTLFDPFGKKIAEANSPNGTKGPEPITLITETAGNYRLEVRSIDNNAVKGRYEVKLDDVRAATKQERSLFAARQAFAEGELLREGATSVSLRAAIKKHEQAFAFFRDGGADEEAATTLTKIAAAYGALSESQKALDAYNQALSIFRALRNRDKEASTLNDIGAFYRETGVLSLALDYFNQGLLIFQELGDRRKTGRTLRATGTVYLDGGESQKAIEYYEQALSLFRALDDQARVADSLHFLGFAYRLRGEDQKAIEYFDKAIATFQALRMRDRENGTLIELAFAYVKVNEGQKALDNLAQAERFFRDKNDRVTLAYVLHGFGIAYRSLGEQKKSLDYFNQALSYWRAAAHESGESMTLYQIARSERANGNLLVARTHIEYVLNHIEVQRAKIGNQELRASYYADQQELYEFYISLLMQLHKQRPSAGDNATALEVSERARARSLLELLSEARTDIRQGVDPALLERERTLQQQLNAKAARQMRLRSDTPSKEQAEDVEGEIDSLNKEINALTIEYRRVEAEIRLKSPRYAAIIQPQPVSLKEIQGLLDRNTMLLEYVLGKDRSYLWAITPTTLNSFELPNRAEIEKAATSVYELLTARSRGPKGETSDARRGRVEQADAEYEKAAAALSELILKPVGAQLGNKRLVIVSDGALQYIPFAALPKPATPPQPAPTRGANIPLIAEHEIVSLPSASTLAVLRRELTGRKPAARTVAVLADPVFDKDDERVRGVSAAAKPVNQASLAPTRDVERAMGDIDSDSRFPPERLTATQWEAEAITKLVPAREAMEARDFAANRQTATGPELSQYRIVHFATHAFINSTHPELSGIVLSLVNERGEPQDGFLRVNEIFNLNLPAELVVLSACQTGLGKVVKGEGMIGMTRAFMYAGAPRVVVSLWSVKDRPTSELMARFYKRMLGAEKLSPSAALRAAQIEMLKDTNYKAPYYWSGFILQGEWK